jgi:hypothetical protein
VRSTLGCTTHTVVWGHEGKNLTENANWEDKDPEPTWLMDISVGEIKNIKRIRIRDFAL